MKAEVVKGWPRNNAIRILLKDTDSSQVNAIRRALKWPRPPESWELVA